MGPTYSVDAACASSLASVESACELLRGGAVTVTVRVTDLVRGEELLDVEVARKALDPGDISGESRAQTISRG